MRKSRFTEEQIVAALKLAQTSSVDEVCRKLSISRQTFYAWKKKFGGMDVSDARRFDGTTGGRTFRTLNVIDRFTRECLVIEVDTSITGQRVVAVLALLVAMHGKPQCIRIHNGPKFVSKALDAWAFEHGSRYTSFGPAKSTENGHVERFNGRLRDECLNQDWFLDLADAKKKIELWRKDTTSEVRPHSSLGYLTPMEYINKLRGVA